MRRLLPDCHGGQVRADIDLVAPLAGQATDMRIKDTTDDPAGRSCAISRSSNRPGDVDSANSRSTLATATMPGRRTSRTATRTTGTSVTTSFARGQSADECPSGHADFSFDELVRAYFDCRQGKRNKKTSLAFEVDLERNLVQLHDELKSGRYRVGRSICFVITRPKAREVWAADFRDRIVHHLLYNRISPRFTRSFIADSCACIPGRGTLYGARRLEAKIRGITQNWSRPAYYMKCDLVNFFVTIDKGILFRLIAEKIPETWWRELAGMILFNDPREGAILQSRPERMALVPFHKSLFAQEAAKGLPIGNLSSQFFANIYLNELDQFIKHRIRAKHYIRYVDDFVLLHESPQFLNDARVEIESFLAARLHLQLNPKKTILQPVDRGIDFVGQLIKPWRRIVRRRTFNDAMFRIEHMPDVDLFESTNSYFGLMRQASHSHSDRIRLGRRVQRRGFAIDQSLTKVYRKEQYV